jgi:hypothetical protein
MRSIVIIALLIGTSACSTVDAAATKTHAGMALSANGGCYGPNGYTGARCPGEHP